MTVRLLHYAASDSHLHLKQPFNSSPYNDLDTEVEPALGCSWIAALLPGVFSK